MKNWLSFKSSKQESKPEGKEEASTAPKESVANSTPKKRRRWLQFGLRSLLVLTLICAVGAWKAGQWYFNVMAECEAIEWFQKNELRNDIDIRIDIANVGASTARSGSPPDWFLELIDASDFRHAVGLTLRLSPSQLKDKAYTDTLAKQVGFLRGLRTIRCNADVMLNPAIRGKLQSLSHLVSVSIEGTMDFRLIPSELLDWMSSSHSIRYLKLNGITITPDLKNTIISLTELETVNLSNVSVCHRDWAELSNLPSVKNGYATEVNIIVEQNRHK